MRTFGNIIWHFPFLGFISATFTYLLGLLLTLTVVAAPIGLGLMELGKLLFWPFGKTMVKQSDLNAEQNPLWKTYSTIVMVLYFPFGLILAFLGVLQVIGAFITIIAIPVGIVVAKSLGTFLNPVGKKCVSSAVAAELERQEALRELAQIQHPSTAEACSADRDISPSSCSSPAGASLGKRCTQCGIENVVSAKFCRSCGNTLNACEASNIPPLSEAEVPCQQCGTALRKEQKFCGVCGTSINRGVTEQETPEPSPIPEQPITTQIESVSDSAAEPAIAETKTSTVNPMTLQPSSISKGMMATLVALTVAAVGGMAFILWPQQKNQSPVFESVQTVAPPSTPTPSGTQTVIQPPAVSAISPPIVEPAAQETSSSTAPATTASKGTEGRAPKPTEKKHNEAEQRMMKRASKTLDDFLK